MPAFGLKSIIDTKFSTFEKLVVDEKSLPLEGLPAVIDYEYEFVNFVLNQGQLGICVAAAGSNFLRFFRNKRLKLADAISMRALYAQAKLQYEAGDTSDSGLQVSDALNAMKQGQGYYTLEADYSSYPNNSEADFPNYLIEAPLNVRKTDFLIKNFVSVNPTVYEIQKALYICGPMQLGITFAEEWMNVGSDGRLPLGQTIAGSHSMLLVKSDSNFENLDGTKGAFTFLNSWSPEYGHKGFIYIPYSFVNTQFWPNNLFTIKI